MLNVLITECEEMDGPGCYEVIGVVGSEKEARELAAEDLHARLVKLEADDDPGICPYVYKMYQRGGVEGYGCVLEISAMGVTRA